MEPLSTVLLVDDYPDALEVWKLYLRAKGFRVLTAVDGFEALSLATAAHPDVVVLDLDLPGKNGLEVARALRQQASTQDIPLIAATGYSHLHLSDLARWGFGSLIIKPCQPDVLVGEIRRLLHQPPPPRVDESWYRPTEER
jgi:CheY-like chemotaxis protein